MTVYSTYHNIPDDIKGCAVALGNFDGVHKGHVHLLDSLRAACPVKVENEPPLAVLTFNPHPRSFFRPQDPSFRLMTSFTRARTLKELDVSHIIELDFNADFAKIDASEFIEHILINKLKATHVACGSDFAFGYRRGGDTDYLQKILSSHGIGITVVNHLCDSQGPLSSSRVRRLLQEGYPEKAAEILGRPWMLRGEVVHGDQRGRLLGFPTANIWLGEHIEPARGVYVARVRLPDGRIINSVANIGRRPTINDNQESRLEVHLLNFDEDLYGQFLEVELLHLLREEKRFHNLDELKAQISSDAREAQKFLEIL